MNTRHWKVPMNEQLRKALDEVGGQPLRGSGFEKETPEPEFTQEPASECRPQQAG
jgi:hypothetical protein